MQYEYAAILREVSVLLENFVEWSFYAIWELLNIEAENWPNIFYVEKSCECVISSSFIWVWDGVSAITARTVWFCLLLSRMFQQGQNVSTLNTKRKELFPNLCGKEGVQERGLERGKLSNKRAVVCKQCWLRHHQSSTLLLVPLGEYYSLPKMASHSK